MSECSPLLSLLARHCGSWAAPKYLCVQPVHTDMLHMSSLVISKPNGSGSQQLCSVTDTASLITLWKEPSKKGCQLQDGCGPPHTTTLSPRDHSFKFLKIYFIFTYVWQVEQATPLSMWSATVPLCLGGDCSALRDFRHHC